MSDQVDLPTILKDFEIACYNFSKNPAARIALNSIDDLRNSKHIIIATRYILTHSNQADVNFQAILGFQEAVLKRWSMFPIREIMDMRMYLFDYLSSLGSLSFPSYVKLQTTKTLASLLKRGWLSTTPQENDLFFSRMAAMLNSKDLDMREIGVVLCKELVSQFSSSSDSTKMSLPWEFHWATKKSFEKIHLQDMFILGLKIVQNILEVNDGERNKTKNLFMRCLELLEHILSWPFLEGKLLEPDTTILDPGEQWRLLLVQKTDVLELYFKMYSLCRGHPDMSLLVTQGLIQLASLTGKIFENSTQQQNYLKNFVQGIFQFMFLPQSSPSEILNCAQVLNRFAVNFPLDMFQNVSTNPKLFFDNLTEFTCNVLFQMQKTDEIEREIYMNAFSELLEAWVLFVGSPYPINPAKIELFSNYCGTIFQFYVEARLAIARRELHSDDREEGIKDYKRFSEQLSSVAHLGRVNVSKVTLLLNNLLGDRLGTIMQHMSDGGNLLIPPEILVEVRWLIMIAGNFLADDPLEESDLSVPPTINLFSSQCPQQLDPVIELIGTIFKIIDFENLCISHKKTPWWDPSLSETLVWFMNRWGRSYLYLSDDCSPNLITAYGGRSSASLTVVHFFIKKIGINLLMRPFESNSAETTCDLLFCVSRKYFDQRSLESFPLSSPSQLEWPPSWTDLVEAHTTGHCMLEELPPRLQRKFLQGLVSVRASEEEGQREILFWKIVTPVKEALGLVLKQIESNDSSTRIGLMKLLISQLEKFRGIVRSSNQNNSNLVWEFSSDFVKTMHLIFRLSKDFHEGIQAVLGLCVDIAKNLLDRISDDGKDLFLENSMKLFEVFHETGFGNCLHRTQVLAREDNEQQAIITKLLNIIHEIGAQIHPKAAPTGFYGISVVIPAITPELLRFPKLAQSYFGAIHNLFENHNHMLSKIPFLLFAALLGNVERALIFDDLNAYNKRCALHSFNFMLSYSLSIKYEESREIFDANQRSIISSFVPKILDFLASGDIFHSEIMVPTSDAFFSLICFDSNTYQQAVQQLISQQSPDLQQQVVQAFTGLQNGVQPIFDKFNKTKFWENFLPFLTLYRNLVRKL